MFRAVILLFITAVLWSTGGILIKMTSCHPLVIAGVRCAIAFPFLTFIYYRQIKSKMCKEVSAVSGSEKSFSLIIANFKFSRIQLAGAVCYCLTVVLFVVATKMTTAANAILLQYSAPIYVAVFGIWLLKERVEYFDWIIISIALFGILLFFLDKLTLTGLWGNIIALITGVSFALLIIFMRMQKDSSPLGTVVLGNFITVIVCLPMIIKNFPVNIETWIGLVLLGVFQLGLAYVLFSIAIKKVTALQGIMIPLIEPILNPLWVLLFYGEEPGWWSIIGGSIVLGAVVIRSINLLNRNSRYTLRKKMA